MDKALIILALLAAGCAAPAPRVVDVGCEWVMPIYLDTTDQFSERTARAILAHNLVWEKRCGGR